jgi:hypothetical protein
MDAYLTFKERCNGCTKTGSVAESSLQMITKTYGVVAESIRAVEVVCIQLLHNIAAISGWISWK